MILHIGPFSFARRAARTASLNRTLVRTPGAAGYNQTGAPSGAPCLSGAGGPPPYAAVRDRRLFRRTPERPTARAWRAQYHLSPRFTAYSSDPASARRFTGTGRWHTAHHATACSGAGRRSSSPGSRRKMRPSFRATWRMLSHLPPSEFSCILSRSGPLCHAVTPGPKPFPARGGDARPQRTDVLH